MNLRELLLVLAAIGSCLRPARCQSQQDLATEAYKDLPEAKLQGAAHAFPSLRDLNGKKLADGEFMQWLEGGKLHVRTTFHFNSEHEIEEDGVFEQKPELVQNSWSWREMRDGRILRKFMVDFVAGKASAEKLENNKLTRWSKQVTINPRKTFAGLGFPLAIGQYRERLIRGERIQLTAIGFTPKPTAVAVEIYYRDLQAMTMSSLVLRGDCFVIHPKIPEIARLFVTVPDTQIWLVNPPPAGFLRWQGPLAEPNDPIVRVDLLPGTESGPAEPVGQTGLKHN